MGYSPPAQRRLHSQGPRLFPHRTLIPRLDPHLESNESELFPLLRTKESPLPESTPQTLRTTNG